MLRLRCLSAVLALSAAPASLAADFTSPEGAVRALEDAYRARDIDAAVAAKSFPLEARLMLEALAAKKGASSFTDEKLVAEAAEVLELSYRKSFETNGFPDMTGVKCSFPTKRELQPDLVELTERCSHPGGGVSNHRLRVAKTERGWRLINVPVGRGT